jgi:8-oxo-dGTP pyrophosphatase MutT (NUDIX family)
LLMTSRGAKRWVIPMGWPIPGLSPKDTAAVEAVEEAGLIGELEDRPLGSYRYLKRRKGQRTAVVQVIVFPFHVRDHAETWKEQGQRVYRWAPYAKAAAMVEEPGLKRLIRDLGAERSPSLLAWGLRAARGWRLAVGSWPALG